MKWRIPVSLPEPVWVSEEAAPRAQRLIRRGSIAYGDLLQWCKDNMTVPADKIWIPRALWFRLISGANVGTRQPFISIADLNGLSGSLGMFYQATECTQESISSGYYSWAGGATHTAVYNAGVEPWETNAMPPILMTFGFILHIDVQNEIAGDTYIVNAILDEYDSGV